MGLLNCADSGSGEPIVLLHAFPLNRNMWQAQFEAWSNRYRVIAPDWRGFGESSLGEEEFTMKSCAEDLRHLLQHKNLQEKVTLLGLSMGGYVAFEFVRKYQELLRSLVLVATQAIGDSDAARQSRFETAEFVRTRGTAALADRMIPRLLGKTSLETTPHVVEQSRALICSNSPEGIARACYGLANRRDSTSALQEITVPTLILVGVEDVIVPGIQADNMHKGIRSSRLSIIEESGHLINLEQPRVFNEQVLSFVQEC